MKKNKFNINPAPVTPDDIEAGKNFEAFHNKYQATQRGSLLRRIGLPLAAVAAAAIVIIVLLFKAPDGETKMVAQFIEPPIKGLERTYEEISFVAAEGLKLDMPSGTIISVPANAFVDANGNPYTGPAKLKYREYTDALSIALSGIPMTYDSAGVAYTFESAGMFDMMVESDASTPLALANGAVVSVGMPATSEDNGFNVYELDTTTKNWALRGKDSIAPVAEDIEPEPAPTKIAATPKPKEEPAALNDAKLQRLYNTIQVIGDSINYYKNLSLLKPMRASTEGHHFNLEMKYNAFPELVRNDLVSWEVAAFTKDFEPNFRTTRWDSRVVTRIKGDQYNLQLIKAGVERNFACKPVYQGQHYAVAVKYYDEVSAANQERLAYIEQRKKELQAEYDAYKKELMASNKEAVVKQEKQLENQYNLNTSQNNVYRFVSVSRMGIWNIDRIYEQPEYVKAETEFVDSKGKVLTMHRMILFEQGVQASFEFFKMPTGNTMRFMYNPNSSYTGLGITIEGKVFLIRPSDIKPIKTEGINTIKAKDFFLPKSEQELRDKLDGLA